MIVRKLNDFAVRKRQELDFDELLVLRLIFRLSRSEHDTDELFACGNRSCGFWYRKDFPERQAVDCYRPRCYNYDCSPQCAIEVVRQSLQCLSEGTVDELQLIDGVEEKISVLG
ncbi:hypothetical protein BLA15945_02530 [Burkholderia lata]|uniref:Uncharacterized protein n=1 Tax=Burkholderia lata (strain ATCC 17760 / DSM 23089 / LMG 22485 / NCIMB 9086 / R18194 / 383) TaxID=482957 RepID=A0A6P2KFB7_BURL3|nr:hypothetical protein BLA15945_02530 [Burkholderia lata]